MKINYSPRFVQLCAIVLAALLLLVVNREFGVADNGDFSRYMGDLASKPVDMKVNWPEYNTEDGDKRFFSQPVFYWSPPDPEFRRPWFSSGILFWELGAKLGRHVFNPGVVNLRYLGLPLFLINFFGLFYFLKRVAPSRLGAAIAFVGMFAVLTDARITAFYNSLYAESIPVLALFLVSAFFAVEIFGSAEHPQNVVQKYVFHVLVGFILLCAIFAKRQYLYFIFPAWLFIGYLVIRTRIDRKYKIMLMAGIALVLVVFTLALTSSFRIDNAGEAGDIGEAYASRMTSYHALYFGLLPHSKHPEPLLEKLGLPADSKKLIGYNVWSAGAQNFIAEEQNVNPKTVVLAIVYDPLAFVKSALFNAQQVGNFDIPLGMVYGTGHQYPPAWLSTCSSAITRTAGVGLFTTAVVVALAMLAFPCGRSREQRFAARALSLMLLAILLSDVFISAFDGQQENTKHVLLASVCTAIILIFGIASLAERLTARHAVAA